MFRLKIFSIFLVLIFAFNLFECSDNKNIPNLLDGQYNGSPSIQITYLFGYRQVGDILLSTHSNTNSWGQPMNPSNVINYPKQGEKSGLITLVRVIAEQSTSNGDAYINDNGGPGYKSMILNLGTRYTTFWKYTVEVYGFSENFSNENSTANISNPLVDGQFNGSPAIQITYLFGQRQNGDRLVEDVSGSHSWGKSQEWVDTVNYPKEGEIGALITFIRLFVEQSKASGAAYMNNYSGPGYKNMSLTFKASTTFLKYRMEVYGK